MPSSAMDLFGDYAPADVDVQLRSSAAPSQTLHRRHVVVVAPHTDLDVGLGEQAAVGGIEAHPSAARHEQLDPRVRAPGAVQRLLPLRVRVDVAADVTGGDPDAAADGQHGVRIVLAHAIARAGELGQRRVDVGGVGAIAEAAEQVAREVVGVGHQVLLGPQG